MSEFVDRVKKIIAQIPKGRVVSYGQVAAMAGSPKASRQVGQILHGSGIGDKLPWWRVVNKQGYLSIRGHDMDAKYIQADKLRAEGVEVSKGFLVDMTIYRWQSATL